MLNPAKPLASEKTTATIYAPDGTQANLPTLVMTAEDAALLRSYKQWLLRNGYKEALYCSRCWESNLAHGTEAFVTTDRIGIRCRCRFTYFQGPTY